MTDSLSRLQSWYQRQCNGDWEHQYGIRLETLDNPGWGLAIDLRGTTWEGQTFFGQKMEGDQHWYHCHVKDEQFLAACGPEDLEVVLRIFLSWVAPTT